MVSQQACFTFGKNDQQGEHESQYCTNAQCIHLPDEPWYGDDADDVAADGGSQGVGWKDFRFHQRHIHRGGIADDGIDGYNLCTHMQENGYGSEDEVGEIKNAFFAGVGSSQCF